MGGEISLVAAAISAGAVGYSISRLGRDSDAVPTPLPGLVSAFVFALQMVNFPIAGGTSGHVLGAALATALVGPWLAIVCMSVVFTVQALIFADGGITALGLNILNGGVLPALVVAGVLFAIRPLVKNSFNGYLVVVGLAAWASVIVAALAIVLEYSIGGEQAISMSTFTTTMLGTHSLIGLAEAAVAVGVVRTVLASRPDIVQLRPLT